ncbi:MAG: hypothetical protein GY803_22300 [Chloroflexi bacterium]|nr:hypothetical protein [Chloroflexota bacterium]
MTITPPTTRDDELARIEREFGIDQDSIQVIDPEWERYMKEGVLVDVHLGRWRARKSLSAKDLGLYLHNPNDKSELRRIEAAEKTMRLGQMYLLPKRVVDQADAIERRARYAVQKWTVNSHWGRFANAETYAKLKENLTRLENDYAAWMQGVYDNWEDLLQEASRTHKRNALSTFKRLQTRYPKLMKKVDVREFVRNYVGRVMSYVIDKESFINSCYFRLELNYVPLLHMLADERAQADATRERATTVAAEEDAKRTIIEEKQRLEMEKIQMEKEKKLAELRAVQDAAGAREAYLREMHRDAAFHLRKQLYAQAKSFVDTYRAQLAGNLYDLCVDIAEYLHEPKNKGKLAPRKGAQIRNLLEAAKALNMTAQVNEVSAIIAQIEGIMGQPSRKRDNAQLAQSMGNAALVMRQELLTLGEEPRVSRDLGLDGDVNPTELNRARRELGLTEVEIGAFASDRAQREW